jgi:hypothetical protein
LTAWTNTLRRALRDEHAAPFEAASPRRVIAKLILLRS